MLNLNSVMIGSMQTDKLAQFYEKVFQKKPDMDQGGWKGWMTGTAYFTVGEHSQMQGPTKDPGRIMFNLETDQVKEEFTRIKDLGATVIKEPYALGQMWIATLADPDGNYFQLVSPWKDSEK